MVSSISLCDVIIVTTEFTRSVEMECNQFKSVVSLIDYLVRSAHARSPPPVSSRSIADRLLHLQYPGSRNGRHSVFNKCR